MEQPLGFVVQWEIRRVYLLRKSLYGLKQSPRVWFGKFSQVVEQFNMQKSKSDYSVFYKNSSSCIILLVVYMDDIVITGSDSKSVTPPTPAWADEGGAKLYWDSLPAFSDIGGPKSYN